MGPVSWIDHAAPSTPAQAVGMLHGHLSAAGLRRLYPANQPAVSSLSIREGLTVWCMGGLFRWVDEHGTAVTHPANDPEGAARRIHPPAPAVRWFGAAA